MLRNVEIKAKLPDLNKTVNYITDKLNLKCQILNQTDTFFNSSNGRLKLREFGIYNNPDELIWYDRPNTDSPKESKYQIAYLYNSVIDDDENNLTSKLKQILKSAVGFKIEVKKRRRVFIYDQTRIHIDEVEGLGNFLELEVVLKENQSSDDGIQIANELMEMLDIKKEDLISCAYADLLENK